MGHGDMQEFNSPSLASIVPCDLALLMHAAGLSFILLRNIVSPISDTVTSMPGFLVSYNFTDTCMRLLTHLFNGQRDAHCFACALPLNLVVQTLSYDIRRMRF